MKTLLEIIVKHHVEGCIDEKMTCNESDPLQFALTVNSTANSPAITPSEMNDTKTKHSTAFVTSNPVKLRYFTSNFWTFFLLF